MTDLTPVVFSEETASVVVTAAAVCVLLAAVVVVVVVAVEEGVAFAYFVVQAEPAQELGSGWDCGN